MSAEHVRVIHQAMTYFMDNLVIHRAFLAEFSPGGIFTSEIIETIMVKKRNGYMYAVI